MIIQSGYKIHFPEILTYFYLITTKPPKHNNETRIGTVKVLSHTGHRSLRRTHLMQCLIKNEQSCWQSFFNKATGSHIRIKGRCGSRARGLRRLVLEGKLCTLPFSLEDSWKSGHQRSQCLLPSSGSTCKLNKVVWSVPVKQQESIYSHLILEDITLSSAVVSDTADCQ